MALNFFKADNTFSVSNNVLYLASTAKTVIIIT